MTDTPKTAIDFLWEAVTSVRDSAPLLEPASADAIEDMIANIEPYPEVDPSISSKDIARSFHAFETLLKIGYQAGKRDEVERREREELTALLIEEQQERHDPAWKTVSGWS